MDSDIDSPRAPHNRPSVLIVGAFLSQSTGIRFVCEDLAEGLRSRGWSVITTSSLKNRAARLGDMLATVWGRRRQYDVAQIDVYSGLAFVWAEAVAASLTALRCPYVLTLHSGAFPEFAERWPGRVRRLLRSAAAVTSPSPYLQERLATYRPDIRIIRNGLHVASYPVRDHVAARPRLVWIRHFEQRYNPVLALDVVSRLAHDFPEIELLMVGSDRQDWSAEQTLEEARRLGVEDRVRVLGPVPKADIPHILQQGDIFLNTTNVDNAPVTVVEAMACGLCVVSTDAGGVPYLVRNEHDALLVPRTDPEAMTAAVRRVLTDSTLAAQLSRNARECAEAFSWETVLSEWEDLLCAVQSRAKTGGRGADET